MAAGSEEEALHAEAQAALGVMYELGQGVPQDYVQAVTWLRKAADH